MMLRDKLLHFEAGFAVAFMVGLLHPALGLLAAAVAGWLKEESDRRMPTLHTRDGWDAFATVVGAAPAQAALAGLEAAGVWTPLLQPVLARWLA